MRSRKGLRAAMSRRRAALGALVAVCLAAVAAPVAGAPEQPALARVEALSQMLRVTSLPDPGAPLCRTTLVGAHGAGASSACPAAGRQAEGGTGSSAAAGAATMEVSTVIETDRGIVATASLTGGPDGSFVTVHDRGAVGALAADGTFLWRRPSYDFTQRTGKAPVVFSQPLPPYVLLGIDPVDPWIRAGERPFAVGDLTGDGVADVAVAHWFFFNMGIDGPAMSMVSVLDGRDGMFVWSRLYPGYVPNLLIEGDTLVIANETGDYIEYDYIGLDGSESSLHGWRFDASAAGVEVTQRWTLSSHVQWARWLALEPAGDGVFASAWTDAPLGSGSPTRGEVSLIEVATGAPRWAVSTPGYPRMLRHDPVSGEVVVLQQQDPASSDFTGYTLTGLAAGDGRETRSLLVEDALALSFRVGDVDGRAGAEWVVGDLGFTENHEACVSEELCFGSGGQIDRGRVTAYDPSAAVALWSQQQNVASDVSNARFDERTPVPQPYGLVLDEAGGGGAVIVGSFMPGREDVQVQRLDGATGSPTWTQRATNLVLPLFLSAHEVGGRQVVMAASAMPYIYGAQIAYGHNSMTVLANHPASTYQLVSGFDVEDGSRGLRVPLFGDILAAVGTDVDGDGTTDLVVGGESGGLFALDGTRLHGGHPGILWQRPLAGAIRQIQLADVDGDGQEELVVAASSEVAVVDSASGGVRYRIPYADDFAWSVTVADVDGDARPDLVVPTSTVAAYGGRDGRELWAYEHVGAGTGYFSTTAVAGGRAVAQYVVAGPTHRQHEDTGFYFAPPIGHGVVALEAATGAVAWHERNLRPTATANRWRGVVAVDGVGGADGPEVVVVWDELTPAGEGAIGTVYQRRIDVYDVGSGERTRSHLPITAVEGSYGVLSLPDGGAQAFGWTSFLVDGEGARPNLSGWRITDMAPVASAGSDAAFVVTSWASELYLAGDETLIPAGGRPSPIAAVSPRVFVGAVHVQDLDDDGHDEVIALPFDNNGHAAVQMPEGRFSWGFDTLAHGMAILTVR